MTPKARIARNKRLRNMTIRELIGLKKRVEFEIKLKKEGKRYRLEDEEK